MCCTPDEVINHRLRVKEHVNPSNVPMCCRRCVKGKRVGQFCIANIVKDTYVWAKIYKIKAYCSLQGQLQFIYSYFYIYLLSFVNLWSVKSSFSSLGIIQSGFFKQKIKMLGGKHTQMGKLHVGNLHKSNFNKSIWHNITDGDGNVFCNRDLSFTKSETQVVFHSIFSPFALECVCLCVRVLHTEK